VNQSRAVETRRNILYAAARVFERKGYSAATIAEILAEADVTKGALYFHFDSKETLANVIVEEQSNWIDENIDLRISPIQRSIDLSYRFIEALQIDPLVRASIRLTLERNTFGTDNPSPYVGWVSLLADILENAAAHGLLLPSVNPRDAAHLLASTVTGTQLTSEAMTHRADLRYRIEQMWVILLPALVPASLLPTLDVKAPDENPVA
jgi:AcrR family transcriptional regulator